MDRIDKTKENLRVKSLEEKERKAMFDKLVKGGGKVIDEHEKRRALAIDRDKQRQFKHHLDTHKGKITQRKKKVTPTSVVRKPMNDNLETGGFADFFIRLKIRLKLRFMKVAKSGGYYFNIKFLERFNNQFKPALINQQVLFLEIFKKDINTAEKIIIKLDSMKPLYYELIEMTGSLYEKNSIDQIVDHYLNFPEVPKVVSELKDPILSLYRKLYVLKPYENSILNAYQSAVQLFKKIDKTKNLNVSSLSKKIDTDLFVLFHKLYPRLHLLFCFFNGRLFDETDPEIEIILSITNAEKPGNRVAGKKRDNSAAAPAVPEKNEKDIDEDYDEEDIEIGAADGDNTSAFDPIAEGYRLMSDIDVIGLKKQYDRKRIFEEIDDNDKIFYTFMYFTSFDRDYSAILTTGKVKYGHNFIDREKIDYKQIFLDLYDQMREIYEAFSDYTESTLFYEKLRKERPIGSSGYIDFTKKLDLQHRKRVDTGKMARMKVRALMEKIAYETSEISADIDSEQNYVDNPDDILQFSSVEGNAKISGRSIRDAFSIVNMYSSAFAHRLGPGGDLSGGIEFEQGKKPEFKRIKDNSTTSDDDISQTDFTSFEDNDKKIPDRRKKDPGAQGTVLDELDDFL